MFRMPDNITPANDDAVVIEKAPGAIIRRLRTCAPKTITEALDFLEASDKKNRREILKSTPTTKVYKIPFFSCERRSLCVKHYSYSSFLNKLKALLVSRPFRAWAAGCYLRERNIPVIEILAFLRKGTFPKEEFLFVTFYENVITLYDYSRQANSELLSCSQQRAVSNALAQGLSSLHKHKVYHNDLKGQNILIDRHHTLNPRCIFCDLDSILVRRRLSLRRIAKNLAQINTSLPDEISAFVRMRFFVSYIRLMEHDGITMPKRKLLHLTTEFSKKRTASRLKRQQASPLDSM